MVRKNLLWLMLFGLFGLGMAQDWEVPEDAKARKNPISVTPEVLAEGKTLYKKQCLMCHGEALKGDGPGAMMFKVQPPDLSTKEAHERLTDGEIFYKMTEGKKPMPSMKSRLTEEERWKVVHYFRSLQAK